MSIHTDRARDIASARGGHAGSIRYADMWKWSKRELIECLIHLAAATGDYDAMLESNGAAQRIREERDNLKSQGII